MHVVDLWWEDGFAPHRVEGFVDAMRDALRAYLRFAGAAGSSGHPTSERRNGSSSLGREGGSSPDYEGRLELHERAADAFPSA